MNKVLAMRTIDLMLKNDFKYLHVKRNLNINTIHLTFEMDSRVYCLQMAIKFTDRWLDILCFISPTILEENSPYYIETLRLINYINWNVKAWGRFYIDDYNDIAYSLRINYSTLGEAFDSCKSEIISVVDIYSDCFYPIMEVSQGEMSYEEARVYIDTMWYNK